MKYEGTTTAIPVTNLALNIIFKGGVLSIYTTSDSSGKSWK